MRWVALPEFPGSLLAMRCRVKKPQVMPTLTWGFLVILSPPPVFTGAAPLPLGSLPAGLPTQLIRLWQGTQQCICQLGVRFILLGTQLATTLCLRQLDQENHVILDKLTVLHYKL